MTFAELCEAVVIPDRDVFISCDLRLFFPEALLRICSSLISYDHVTTKVTLAHSSVLQYLTSQGIQRSDVREFYLERTIADNDITICCLNYLSLPAFSSGYCSPEEAVVHRFGSGYSASKVALSQRFEEWPLFQYIADTLFDHLSYIALDDPIKALLKRFFETQSLPRGGNFGAWVQAFTPQAWGNIESSTPLYYAARFGLLPVVKMILAVEGTKNLETPGGVYGSTPLHVATWQGRTNVVRELLNAGANAREINDDGKPGLLWAVKFGFKEIERMLRDAGATLDEGMNLEGLVDFTEDRLEEDDLMDWVEDVENGSLFFLPLVSSEIRIANGVARCRAGCQVPIYGT